MSPVAVHRRQLLLPILLALTFHKMFAAAAAAALQKQTAAADLAQQVGGHAYHAPATYSGPMTWKIE